MNNKIPIGFFTEKEYEDKKLFAEQHYKSCRSGIELILRDAGTGHMFKCRCIECGETKDITDYNAW